MLHHSARGPSARVAFLTAAAIMAVGLGDADARPARPAPPLPKPAGAVVNVRTESELREAVASLRSNVTIVLAPGTYRLMASLNFRGPLRDVGIRGATANADDVVLVGGGMTKTDSVPYGIWTGDGVDGITIANMTIREFYFHPIIFNGGTERPHVYNVRLVDAGQQFIKSNPAASGVGASNGIVEYSVFEFTATARDDYPKGIDVHGGANWVIRDNLFRNLQAPPGQLIGPAVLIWRGSSGTIAERNTFINCGRGIVYGLEDAPGSAHRGGVIRNNFFYRSATQPGDVGIQVADSPGTQVVNNTILLSGTYMSAIEYRFAGSTDVVIANNLVDAMIRSREGATAMLVSNVTNATADMFVNAVAGDLHLRPTAGAAIDQGSSAFAPQNDWDGQRRPGGKALDIGADEYAALAAAAASPRMDSAAGAQANR